MSTPAKRKTWLIPALIFGGFFVFIAIQPVLRRIASGEGERAGVLVKLGHKGLFRKSWEGELMLGGIQSGKTWDFSLDPGDPNQDSLVHVLQEAQTNQTTVLLKYNQRFIGPWMTETNYLVAGVKPVVR
ncbi:MAG TPA: hypothetical protein DCQ83_06275 [Fibrobacteres bacterium]|jgi:hypothetical protein|nr:hypothetical protein [Fibrobacterota bacterium]